MTLAAPRRVGKLWFNRLVRMFIQPFSNRLQLKDRKPVRSSLGGDQRIQSQHAARKAVYFCNLGIPKRFGIPADA